MVGKNTIPCPVEHENPNENWEPSSEFKDELINLAEQVAEYDLRVSILLWDALEILEETKRPDEWNLTVGQPGKKNVPPEKNGIGGLRYSLGA